MTAVKHVLHMIWYCGQTPYIPWCPKCAFLPWWAEWTGPCNSPGCTWSLSGQTHHQCMTSLLQSPHLTHTQRQTQQQSVVLTVLHWWLGTDLHRTLWIWDQTSTEHSISGQTSTDHSGHRVKPTQNILVDKSAFNAQYKMLRTLGKTSTKECWVKPPKKTGYGVKLPQNTEYGDKPPHNTLDIG